jgi:hypothetical protein
LFDLYQFQNSAVKVVGVGSIGTRCYAHLLLAEEDDPLFPQSKEAGRSVLESPEGKSRFPHQGLRVVEGLRLMQAASDIFLGWFRSANGHDYYVRQFRDMKVSPEPEPSNPPLSKHTQPCVAGGPRAGSCKRGRCGDDRWIPGLERVV